MAFLFRFIHAASVISSGLTSSRAPSQSLRKRMPNILSFHKSKPLPSNLLISNKLLTSEEVEAMFAH
ncbi:hypothetical protein KP509_05G086200 [Ceratopteris richardii]|uniref:Uncharacterized protein n=1 Tax=Ceratopteris richardii TaxID=49495 RepID=A0A8T2UII1_CERRI|nr:hypothetical protein KP509_06G083800 [Ceratopteris richardii]KAH7437729.1 hypothetical protein KP509_05G086200 [Ceratopteris richardii]